MNTHDFIVQAAIEFDRRQHGYFDIIGFLSDDIATETNFILQAVLEYDRTYRAAHHGKPPQNLQYQYFLKNPNYTGGNDEHNQKQL